MLYGNNNDGVLETGVDLSVFVDQCDTQQDSNNMAGTEGEPTLRDIMSCLKGISTRLEVVENKLFSI